MTRQICIIPMNETNRDAETLAWARKRGETFEVYAMDDKGPFSSMFFATRTEAVSAARNETTAMGWDVGSFEISVDE